MLQVKGDIKSVHILEKTQENNKYPDLIKNERVWRNIVQRERKRDRLF